jgi:signal peptidase I
MGRTGTPGRVVAVGALLALATLVVRRSLLRVQGPSMRPTFEQDDLVVTVPLPPAGDGAPRPVREFGGWLRRRLVTPGRIVVLANPDAPSRRTVKRVTAVDADGVDVIGDDPGWSIDSRVFGSVPHRDVRRIVVGRLGARRHAPSR